MTQQCRGLSQNEMMKDKFDTACTNFQVRDGIIHSIHTLVTIMRIFMRFLTFLPYDSVPKLKNGTFIGPKIILRQPLYAAS